jgi:hypothetical protein
MRTIFKGILFGLVSGHIFEKWPFGLNYAAYFVPKIDHDIGF